uniref:EGF-like domain-containing protein n=1 Tax=Bursaphelenchus xylophilus TaxID=6326 RepID=A0A1I7SCZ5_BURXY
MRVVLRLTLFLHLAYSDLVRRCEDKDLCQHGGECFLTAARQSSAKCPDGRYSEVDESCLHYSPIKKTFNDAYNFCRTRYDGHLVWLESKEKRAFVEEWIGKSAWIGLQRDGQSKARWHPGGGVTTMDVEDGTAEKSGTHCGVLYHNHGQPKILTEFCDESHGFVCESNISRFKGADDWIAQCSCPSGYGGRQCEIKLAAEKTENSSDKELCGIRRFEESCQENEVLMIDYAIYGYSPLLKYDGLCPLTSNLDHDCIESAGLLKLAQRCQYRQKCVIEDLAKFFENPTCSNGARLKYRVRCVEKKELACPHGMKILGDRCISISDNKEKKTYADARAECTQKGGDLAYFDPSIDFTSILKGITPLPSSEYWIHNSSEKTNHFGPRKSECLTASWWSPNVGQVPCFAMLGWICEFVPNGIADRVLVDKLKQRKYIEEDKKEKSGEKDKENPRFCKGFKFLGQKIPETKACYDFEAECPQGLSGKIILTCDCARADWTGLEDHSRCMSPSLSALKDLVRTDDPFITVGKYEHVIYNLMGNSKLTSGDIFGFLESGDSMMAMALQRLDKEADAKKKKIYSKKFAKSIGNTGDYLMDKRAEKAWYNMTDDHRVARAARLMQMLQNVLVLQSHGMANGSEDFKFSHFASKLEVKPEVQYAPGTPSIRIAQDVPEPETVSFDGFQKAASMEMPSSDLLSFAVKWSHESKQMSGGLIPRMRTLNPSPNPPSADNTLKVGHFMFSNLGNLMSSTTSKRRVNSYIMGAFVNDPAISVDLMNDHVSFTFYHLVKDGVKNPKCVFWNLTTSSWDDKGCEMSFTNDEYTKCTCSHLTSFAILMDFTNSLGELRGREDGYLPAKFVDETLDWLTIIGCALSIISLTFCILIFTIFRSLYNSRTTIHRNLCLSLLMAEIFFLFGIEETEPAILCSGVAIALHYFFLCAFAWMLLEGYQLYLMLIKVFDARSRTLWYYCCGYLIPAIIVLLSVLVAAENYGTANYCWIDVTSPTIWTFVGPIGLIVLFNSGVLVLALRTVLAVRNRDRSLAAKVLGWLKGSAMLLFLLGITWVFGFLSAIHVLQPYVAYIFTILNSLQGTFIFFLHVVMNDKARQCVLRCLKEGVCCQSPVTSSSHSKNGIRPDSSSTFNKTNNFFALRKDKILQWWPLKSSASNSKNSNSNEENRRSSEVASPPPSLKTPKEVESPRESDSKEEEDETVTRRRLLSPVREATVTVERF